MGGEGVVEGGRDGVEGSGEDACWVEDAKESTLIMHIQGIFKFPSKAKSTRIISGQGWIGMFSDEEVDSEVHARNPLDMLCTRLERIMWYEKREIDLVVLTHKFVEGRG